MTRLTLTLILLLTACGSTVEPETPEPATPATKHEGEMKHDGDERPAGEAMYACPMHPDVTSHDAGDCSRCGMALVKQEAHDHGSHDHGDEAGTHDEPDDHGH